VIGPVTIIGAPSAIGIRPYDDGGVRRLDLAPGVLRERRLAARLDARDLGDVMPPQRYQDVVKPAGRARNETDVIAYSRKLAQHVAAASGDGSFVLLLGGDCSILLGALLGLRTARREPVGLAYIDAHSDFAALHESLSGSAASMNLGLAVGHANDTPLNRLADEPLVQADNVVHMGARDAGEPYGYDAMDASEILNLPGDILATNGPAHTARQALERLSKPAGGFWIATDVDVLDPELMPAVDTPQPGGLTFAALADLLRSLVHDPRALGMQLTIYDPTLDTGLAGADQLVDLLEDVFAGEAPR
jgi:arginase